MNIFTFSAYALLVSAILTTSLFASASEEKENLVRWRGYVVADGPHSTDHSHDLDFVRQSDGATFDIVDSPELERLHCQTSSKLLVDVLARRTPSVIFWGDNLQVRQVRVLKELEFQPHKKPVKLRWRKSHLAPRV